MIASKITKVTPVLVVTEIESCLAFWTQLGFEKTVEVPHEEKLGFVILGKDGLEIMYQSCASALADVPALGDRPSVASLYIEVENLDDIISRLKNVKPVVPRRRAFYGADEIFVREPGGNIVGFAQPPSGAAPT